MSLLDIHITDKTFAAAGEAHAHKVLHNVSLSVAPGEVVALTGPSGCGKSTLLSLVAGLDQAYEGRIMMAGETSLAMVFQEPRLLPWRSVHDNLALVLPDTPDRSQRISAVLDAVGLPDKASVFASRLSLGMARRVALARAFILQPDLMLLDEPFTSLDERHARKLRALLRRLLQEQGVTALFVTHDLGEAIELADRIVVMDGQPASIVHEEMVGLDQAARRDSVARETRLQRLRMTLGLNDDDGEDM